MQTLTTDRLSLVPLDTDRDAGSLHAMLGDPEMYAFDVGGPTGDLAESRARLAEELAGNGGWTWAIRLRPADAAIGTIGLFYDQGTSIRGLSWKLRRDHWGRGIMGEAARPVVDHLLAQPGIDGVEAWIDSRNTRSLGVARRARLDEHGRLPRVYDDHTAQQVVMARSAEQRDPDVFAVRPTLRVSDVRATVHLLSEVLGLHVGIEYGDPPTFARLGVGPWSGSPGVDIAAADGDIVPTTMTADVGVPTDTSYARATAAGVHTLGPPEDQPWSTREYAFRLPDGHDVRVIGPSRPTTT